MTLSDKAEEILERLWTELVEDRKKSCDITVIKDDEAVKELLTNGCVNVASSKAILTEKGAKEAEGCIRRHRLAERLLVDVLDMKKPLVHETSCDFEHLLHKGLDENVCTLLGHPKTCPHGRPIPQGRCCRESRKEAGKVIVPLSELETNQKAVISYLHTHDRDALQKLIAMGVLPKTDLILLQRFPTLVLQIGKSQFAIDKELASHVHVRRPSATQ